MAFLLNNFVRSFKFYKKLIKLGKNNNKLLRMRLILFKTIRYRTEIKYL